MKKIRIFTTLMCAFTIVELLCRHSLALNPNEPIDYSTYDSLLKKYVTNGKVDYLRWKERDFETFSQYIKSIGNVNLKDLNHNERKAFWINAYNAVTIYAVLERIPEKKEEAAKFSVRKVRGFFDRIAFTVAGEWLTLNDIENNKLRKGYEDPRIHFAIVCASTSCPVIISEAYLGETVDKILDERAMAFIGDDKRNSLDRDNNILYLSKIFTWFKEDFINNSGSVLDYVLKYISEENARYISKSKVTVKSLPYNWSVNIG